MNDSFNDVVLEKNGTDKVAMTLSTSGKNGLKNFKRIVSVDGTQVSLPVKGINIVRYSDGRVVKTVVR